MGADHPDGSARCIGNDGRLGQYPAVGAVLVKKPEFRFMILPHFGNTVPDNLQGQPQVIGMDTFFKFFKIVFNFMVLVPDLVFPFF